MKPNAANHSVRHDLSHRQRSSAIKNPLPKPFFAGKVCASSIDGEEPGTDEGGGVRAVAVPAEGDDRTVEGHPRQDPSEGLRELDLRFSPPRPPRRHLLVCPKLPGEREAGAQVLILWTTNFL